MADDRAVEEVRQNDIRSRARSAIIACAHALVTWCIYTPNLISPFLNCFALHIHRDSLSLVGGVIYLQCRSGRNKANKFHANNQII
jgi:hypothetical protein